MPIFAFMVPVNKRIALSLGNAPFPFFLTAVFSFFSAPLCLQEICYLDQVLDAASEISTNGESAPFQHSSPITVSGNSPSVFVSASPSLTASTAAVVVEGQRQTTVVHQGEPAAETNGHALGDGPRFELRAFHEEKRPAKLFTPGEEHQQVRVTRRRPTEEVSNKTHLKNRLETVRFLKSWFLKLKHLSLKLTVFFGPDGRSRSWSENARNSSETRR